MTIENRPSPMTLFRILCICCFFLAAYCIYLALKNGTWELSEKPGGVLGATAAVATIYLHRALLKTGDEQHRDSSCIINAAPALGIYIILAFFLPGLIAPVWVMGILLATTLCMAGIILMDFTRSFKGKRD